MKAKGESQVYDSNLAIWSRYAKTPTTATTIAAQKVDFLGGFKRKPAVVLEAVAVFDLAFVGILFLLWDQFMRKVALSPCGTRQSQ